jgi:predicted RecA/RadA family phage recombinase
MQNFVQAGDNITVDAAPYALASGDGCLVGAALFGVATGPADSGAEVILATRGVFDVKKATGLVTAGALLFWDNTAKKLTTEDEDGTVIVGVAVAGAASDALTARVKLSGVHALPVAILGEPA